VAGPQDAAACVRAPAAQGADYLKVYLEDPAWYGSPVLSAATVRALVVAAHSHGMLAADGHSLTGRPACTPPGMPS
jgi:hypothetical protein